MILPERIDVEWYWYHYAHMQEHVVQSAIEKRMLRAGFHLVDVSAAETFSGIGSLKQLLIKERAVELAKELGAHYLILGEANAVRMSSDVAYGVSVHRVENADADAGGQAQRTAGRDALKEAGKAIAKKIVREAERITANEQIE